MTQVPDPNLSGETSRTQPLPQLIAPRGVKLLLATTLLTAAYQSARCYWYWRTPRTQGVYVAVWWRGTLLLIRNSYKSGQTFPAGGVKRGESNRCAAVRELREEVGLTVSVDSLRSAGNFLSRAEYKLDYCEVFEVELTDEPQLCIDGWEVSAAQFVRETELARVTLSSIASQYLAARAEKTPA